MEGRVSPSSGRYSWKCDKLKQITVLSGKGGTGKTTLVASFAVLAGNLVVTDCDVDAPNLHMLLGPVEMRRQEFKGSKVAVMDDSRCNQCGKCEEGCRFGAIKGLKIDPVLCEGCGLCVYLCPTGAIRLEERTRGCAYISRTKYGFMSHARLNPGEENSGKLVTLVRQNASRIAEEEKLDLVLNDGPPGIGCPAIASASGVDLGIVVVEPTLSGIHDMERALRLLRHFRVKSVVCINKHDLNAENTEEVERRCADDGLVVAGRISFDPVVTHAMVSGKPVLEHSPDSTVSREIKEVWGKVLEALRVT